MRLLKLMAIDDPEQRLMKAEILGKLGGTKRRGQRFKQISRAHTRLGQR